MRVFKGQVPKLNPWICPVFSQQKALACCHKSVVLMKIYSLCHSDIYTPALAASQYTCVYRMYVVAALMSISHADHSIWRKPCTIVTGFEKSHFRRTT